MKPSALSNHRGSTITPCSPKRGFTMIELLAVIAAIAILSCLMLPALAKAKPESQGVRCLNNIRQLELAANAYPDDFGGIWVPNQPGQTCWVNLIMNFSGNTDNTNINKLIDPNYCLLANYVGGNPKIFHCPGDKSFETTVLGGGQYMGPRVRSVSMNHAVGSVWTNSGCLVQNGPVNGQWLTGANIGSVCQTLYRTYGKTTDFVVPGPSSTWVFTDEHCDSMNDSLLAVQCAQQGIGAAFIDRPANYHNGAAPFSFVDGHAEMKKWLGPTLGAAADNWGGPQAGGYSVVNQADNQDLIWLQQRTSVHK